MTQYRIKAIFLPTGKVQRMICGAAGFEAMQKSPHWHIFDIKIMEFKENI